VGLASKTIMNLDSESAEQYVLKQIERLQHFNQLTGHEAFPPQSIERSTFELNARLEKTHAKAQALSERISSLEKELEVYTSVAIQGMSEESTAGVMVLETLNTKPLGEEPSLNADEQGFDSVEYVQ